MKKIFGAAVLAVAAFMAFSLEQAQAAYCGACSYTCCRPCATEFTTQCNVVMKTCRKVVCENQQVTCYRTEVERVPVTRQCTFTKYVPERQARQVTYTVNRMVWENCQKTVNRTVRRVVWENVQKQVPYTVMVPVTEQKTRTYTVNRTVWTEVPQQITYTKMVPVTEQKTRTYTVNRMVYEQRQKEVPYTVMVPVTEQKTRTYTVNRRVWTEEIGHTSCRERV